MIPGRGKAFVLVSEGNSPACSQELEDFYLRLVLHSTIIKKKTKQNKKVLTVFSKRIPGHNVFVAVVITETRLRN